MKVYFYRICATSILCLLTLLTAGAQRFCVTELPNQEQLPVANVHRIMQDSEGLMWYATEGGGLCRDDGYRIEIFRSDKNNPSLLESNDITCLTEDGQGRIWFGTSKGVYILDKRDYNIRRLEEKGIKGSYIHCIHASEDGSVWISASRQIFRFIPTSPHEKKAADKNTGKIIVESYASAWKGSPRSVVNFCKDGLGNLFAIQEKGGGILRFDQASHTFREVEWQDDSTPNHVIPGPGTNELWVATWGNGIARCTFDEKRQISAIIHQSASLGREVPGSFRSQVFNLVYDKRHALLWAAAMDDLYAYQIVGGTLVPYDTEGFLPKGKKILDNVILDRKGNLWVPGYSPHTFIVQATQSRLRRDSVKAMSDIVGYRVMVDRLAREDENLYWIWQGRTNLSLYDARSGKMAFADSTALPSPFTTAKCLEKRRGEAGIWTCNGKKLLKVWNKGLEIFWETEKDATLHEDIRTLHDDGQGNLYIGTTSAIYKYDYKGHVLRMLSASTGVILDLTVAADGTVYFVSEKEGFCSLPSSGSPSGKHHVILSGTESPNGFSSLAVAPDSSVWAGTSGGEVYRYTPKDGKLNNEEKAGNMNGDAVKKIVVDAFGHVWILADKYLKEYSPEKGTLHLFHSSSRQINMDYFHTLSLEGDSICLGGIGAFCMIAPSNNDVREEDGRPVPTLWIAEGIRHLPGPDERKANIGSKTEGMEIFVSTFDYLYADSIQYAYRLDDNKWTVLPKGTNRIALEGIPHGISRLEVKATDHYGVWQPSVACLTICRARHWSIIACCYTLFILAISGGVFLYVRKRKKTSGRSRPSGPCTPPKRQEEPAIPVQNTLQKGDEEFLRKAKEIVEKNIDNADYSVEQFSSDLCMSRMNLYRKLQTLTSQKPSEFIRDIRLEKAVELMQASDFSTSEIADRVGFGTSRYFSKCFKDKYGVSPSQFRTKQSTSSDNKIPTESEQM